MWFVWNRFVRLFGAGVMLQMWCASHASSSWAKFWTCLAAGVLAHSRARISAHVRPFLECCVHALAERIAATVQVHAGVKERVVGHAGTVAAICSTPPELLASLWLRSSIPQSPWACRWSHGF